MTEQMIEIECHDRWQAYHRLKDLDIACECRAYRPLKVQIDSPYKLLQVWSALQTILSDREQLITRLNGCWAQPSRRHSYFLS